MFSAIMLDHDRLFKELLTTFFVEFLELFFPELGSYVSLAQLERLAEALLDFSSPKDLENWFARL